jgi:hypothetical protein
MKVTLTNRRKWLIGAGAALLLTATPSFALFGIGDIVFDPTSYASLVSQLTTLQSQYNMLKNNITHFSAKQQWQTTLHALENVNVANMFGETAGMSIALNTNSPSASSTAWKAATVTMNGGAPTYLAGQSLAARTQNATANNSLLSQQFDGGDGTNSEVQQLNLLNASEAQRLAEMQSQGTLHACLASQMTVANMERRNAAVEDLNTAAFVQQQRSTNDVSAANESSTWQTYLP